MHSETETVDTDFFFFWGNCSLIKNDRTLETFKLCHVKKKKQQHRSDLFFTFSLWTEKQIGWNNICLFIYSHKFLNKHLTSSSYKQCGRSISVGENELSYYSTSCPHTHTQRMSAGWSRVLRKERGNTLWPPCSWPNYWRCRDNKEGCAVDSCPHLCPTEQLKLVIRIKNIGVKTGVNIPY